MSVVSAYETARRHFEQKDDARIEVVNSSVDHGYLDLAFGHHHPGVFNSDGRELAEDGVIISGFQPGTGRGDVRVWFKAFAVTAETTIHVED